jgi:hypothetical protein
LQVALQGEQALGIPLLEPKHKKSDKDKKRKKDKKHKKDKHRHKKVGCLNEQSSYDAEHGTDIDIPLQQYHFLHACSHRKRAARESTRKRSAAR